MNIYMELMRTIVNIKASWAKLEAWKHRLCSHNFFVTLNSLTVCLGEAVQLRKAKEGLFIKNEGIGQMVTV